MLQMAQGSLDFADRPSDFFTVADGQQSGSAQTEMTEIGDVTGPRNGDFAGHFFSAFTSKRPNLARAGGAL